MLRHYVRHRTGTRPPNDRVTPDSHLSAELLPKECDRLSHRGARLRGLADGVQSFMAAGQVSDYAGAGAAAAALFDYLRRVNAG